MFKDEWLDTADDPNAEIQWLMILIPGLVHHTIPQIT